VSGSINIEGLSISNQLYKLVNEDILAGLDTINAHSFWSGLAKIVHKLAPKNKKLLQKRQYIQDKLDAWHKNHRDSDHNSQTHFENYKAFLKNIDYLLPEGEDFQISTQNVDDEIARIAGPQLVVPVNNARYALNAANARWGSLFDAYYGTDVIAEDEGLEKGHAFNEARGHKVMALGFQFLDQVIPLKNAQYQDVTAFRFIKNTPDNAIELEVQLNHNQTTRLQNPMQFRAYQQEDNALTLLFCHNDLHIELLVDARHPIGKLHPSGIRDIILESAITTIQDCEDSVAAVDAGDKTRVYKNWLGLMRGDLQESVEKQGKHTIRRLNADKHYTRCDGTPLILSGRSLMLIRNVGLLMTTDAVVTESGDEIPEGILDALITSLIALYDIQGKGRYQNSKSKSIYIVKPKMHGPEEVAFTCTLFSMVEDVLKLPRNTLKIGIMDEERRTTVNLKECIRAAKERLIFINTGFLDRTGDEIHSSMEAGIFLPKAGIKKQPWIKAYEDWNVDIGLQCGLQGKAQIGKGMWAMPDLMAQMLKEKIAHPLAGANCAWVPSPTAATLHATHYHQVNVQKQQSLLQNRQRASLDDILDMPLFNDAKDIAKLGDTDIQQELDNNAQGILGYVVRWIDQGIGCSKVPDIHGTGLMEDRATLRISSQHMANWLHHGLCSKPQIIDSFQRMASVVDRQNANDPAYHNMAPKFNSIAYQTALDLVLKGCQQPNGYTEPLLHAYRKKRKKHAA
jgi:malate synthase